MRETTVHIKEMKSFDDMRGSQEGPDGTSTRRKEGRNTGCGRL